MPRQSTWGRRVSLPPEVFNRGQGYAPGHATQKALRTVVWTGAKIGLAGQIGADAAGAGVDRLLSGRAKADAAVTPEALSKAVNCRYGNGRGKARAGSRLSGSARRFEASRHFTRNRCFRRSACAGSGWSNPSAFGSSPTEFCRSSAQHP
jgi:hypothetical protein